MLEALLNIRTRTGLPTDRKAFFTARASQVNMDTMKRFFEQWFELQVAKYLKVHLLISSYNVSSFEFRNEKRQRSNGAFVSPTICFSIKSVYIMRECMRTMSYADSGLWRLFPLNNHPNSLPTLLTEMCPRSVVEGGADQTGGGGGSRPSMY